MAKEKCITLIKVITKETEKMVRNPALVKWLLKIILSKVNIKIIKETDMV